MNVIIFVAIYLPFQEFILKWIPVGDGVFFFLRQVPDLLLLGLFIALLSKRLVVVGKVPVIGRGVDFYLGGFLVWAIAISLATTGSNGAVNFSEVHTLLRYSVLLYCIQLVQPTSKEIRLLLHIILYSVLFQAVIGAVQFLGGAPARDFLAARDYASAISGVEKVFTGARDEGSNNLMGTMGDNINFAYLMAIGVFLGTALWCNRRFRHLMLVLLFVMLLFSGSRAIFISTLVVFLLYVLWVRNREMRNVLLLSIFLFLGMSFLVLREIALTMEYDYSSFWALFRSEIVTNLMNQRLGMVVFFLPELVASGDFLLGLSPDRFFIAQVAHQYGSVPPMLLTVFEYVFEDFYWLAMLSYYGTIGFGFWVLFLGSLGSFARPLLRAEDSVSRSVGFMALMLLLLTIPLNMANQAFESRYFSFYLWLFVGLSVFLRRKQLQRQLSKDAYLTRTQ